MLICATCVLLCCCCCYARVFLCKGSRRYLCSLLIAGRCFECRYRWGDAPLRYFSILLFLDVATEVHQFKDIVYAHRHWLYVNGLDFDFQKRGQLPDFGDLG